MEAFQGGDLYQMQQEAIKRARETAEKASPKKEAVAVKDKMSFLPDIGSDGLIIVAVLAVLLLNGCNDMLLILALVLMLIL